MAKSIFIPLSIFISQIFPLLAYASEQTLGTGSVIVKTEVDRETEYPLKVEGILRIEAGPEVVWDILTDYEHLVGVFPNLQKSQVVKREAGEVVVEQHYRGLLLFSRRMEFANRETPIERIDFRRLDGKTKVTGCWKLESGSEVSTLVTLEVAIKPRRFLPIWVVAGVLKRQVPQGLISIRRQSLASLNINDPEDPEIIHMGEEEEDNPSLHTEQD